jgi:peptidoglycan/LPS O-acetylase OafA/YrhL
MRPQDDYFVGLDAVRFVAICLVTGQHVLTLSGCDELTVVAGLSLGQIGVAIFLAISGLLATESRRPPVEWLFQRLRRIFPAYWVVIGASLFLAWVTGYKSFGAGQVLAQSVGIGLYTHGNNLVNTPTWFVSLLLVCYLGSFVARLVGASWVVGVGATVTLAVVVASTSEPWLSAHFLTYALATTLALASPRVRLRLGLLSAVVLFLLAFWWQTAFGYPAVALVAVELSLLLGSVPRLIRVVAAYSYEYYLVHGIALLAMVRWLPAEPVAAVSGALVLAAAAAVALHRVVGSVEKVLKRTATSTPKPQGALQVK